MRLWEFARVFLTSTAGATDWMKSAVVCNSPLNYLHSVILGASAPIAYQMAVKNCCWNNLYEQTVGGVAPKCCPWATNVLSKTPTSVSSFARSASETSALILARWDQNRPPKQAELVHWQFPSVRWIVTCGEAYRSRRAFDSVRRPSSCVISSFVAQARAYDFLKVDFMVTSW